MNYANIRYEVKGSIAYIIMNRPNALNALNSETLNELSLVVDQIAQDKSVLGVIVTGEGKAFVSGADISEFADYGSEEGRNFAGTAQKAFSKIENLEKPVIAAINGYALGGGCELALSCDIRIASDNAIFGQPEVALGVMPCFGGTQRLSRLIGVGWAKEMIYTGRFVKAEEALRLGLVNKVVSGEELLKEAEEMMQVIISKAPIAIKYSKISINRGVEMDMDNALELEKDVFALCCSTEDKKEGTRAFLEKRQPIFKNK